VMDICNSSNTKYPIRLRSITVNLFCWGGMMQQSTITHTEGLPKLKKLPYLGWLFGQEKNRQSDYEIWIMIRPSILKSY
jgi:Flp pilus assembly secretin CpaC